MPQSQPGQRSVGDPGSVVPVVIMTNFWPTRRDWSDRQCSAKPVSALSAAMPFARYLVPLLAHDALLVPLDVDDRVRDSDGVERVDAGLG